MTNRSNQSWPEGEAVEINPLADRLVEYLEKHYLPSSVNADGSIQTINEYVDRDGVFHSEPISLPCSVTAVREFLGY